MSTAAQVKTELQGLADPLHQQAMQRFFQTGKGQYGEGDVFLGIKVPEQRKVARRHRSAPLREVRRLLRSRTHEHRLVALLILVEQFQRGGESAREEIFQCCADNLRHIDNWDLVDLAAPKIVGAHLLDRPRDLLVRLARSDHLWSRRVAIMATLAFIRHGQFDDTLALARVLLHDRHDLIHKAVGWMLREVGKRDLAAAEAFLDAHHRDMPRTMLRYALEKFDADRKAWYMRK